jgi:hypothetical protein
MACSLALGGRLRKQRLESARSIAADSQSRTIRPDDEASEQVYGHPSRQRAPLGANMHVCLISAGTSSMLCGRAHSATNPSALRTSSSWESYHSAGIFQSRQSRECCNNRYRNYPSNIVGFTRQGQGPEPISGGVAHRPNIIHDPA